MREVFKSKCKHFEERLNVLYSLLEELKQGIIIKDLSEELNISINVGFTKTDSIDWVEEIDVSGESFTLINRTKNKYCSYVVYTAKEYHTVGLGLMYKKEIVAPHMNSMVEGIISKYNDVELGEIIDQMDDYLVEIEKDIDYLKTDTSFEKFEHYYGEYNKGFESRYKYDTILDVLNDYKKDR